jgi:large subunit ribosomal protein L4
MELNLLPLTVENQSGIIHVSDKVFGCSFNESLIHQVIVAYLAGARSGTRAQETRAEVSGGGSKPWRQKGTGRARAGTTRGPIWRGGGVTFAASPADHSQKVNKQMYRAAMRSMWSELLRQERLVTVDSLSIEAPKTKSLLAKLMPFQENNILIVVENQQENLYLAARNLHKVTVKTVTSLNPVDLVSAEKVIITTSAIKLVEERLG